MPRQKLTPEEREKRIRESKRRYQERIRRENPEEVRAKAREYARKWRKDNPEKEAAIQARYNAKIAGFTYQESNR